MVAERAMALTLRRATTRPAEHRSVLNNTELASAALARFDWRIALPDC